jgi:hypothetical protein
MTPAHQRNVMFSCWMHGCRLPGTHCTYDSIDARVLLKSPAAGSGRFPGLAPTRCRIGRVGVSSVPGWTRPRARHIPGRAGHAVLVEYPLHYYSPLFMYQTTNQPHRQLPKTCLCWTCKTHASSSAVSELAQRRLPAGLPSVVNPFACF